MELAAPITVTFPSKWTLGKLSNEQTVKEIDGLAQILVTGCEAIAGVYSRLCDTIRQSDLSERQIRNTLEKYFSQPRVSEIMRVSRAPDEVYRKYTAGFFGFKAALRQCRLYNITPTEELNRRKALRAAERLVLLTGGQGKIEVRGKVVTIT